MFTVKAIPLKDIKVSDRARTDRGDIDALARSIENQGLLNPLVVDEEYNLIAGERRFTALKQLNIEEVACTIIPGITQDDKLLVELVENTTRKDFAWTEEVALKKKIHDYYVAQNSKWSYRDTANKLGLGKTSVTTDITLAEAILEFPALKQYDTKRRAYRAFDGLCRQVDALDAMADIPPDVMEAITGKVNQPEESTEKDDTDSNAVNIHYEITDCISYVQSLHDGSVGLCELDPPYAIRFHEIYGKAAGMQSSLIDWSDETFVKVMGELIPLLKPKMIKDSWIIIWHGFQWIDWLHKTLNKHGLRVQKPGIWVKPSGGSNAPHSNMIPNYEMFTLAAYGGPKFNTPSLLAAFEAPSPPASARIHQTEKPIKGVYDRLFSACGRAGTCFLSCFAGSGNSLIAAHEYGMYAMGCDKSNKYRPQFLARVKEYFDGKNKGK